MKKVQVRAFESPAVVLLALDWAEGARRRDFLGFSIRRRRTDKGASAAEKKWAPLPNRLSFSPAKSAAEEHPSTEAPIQKFMWWDARVARTQKGGERVSYEYEVTPLVGTPRALDRLDEAKTTIAASLPFAGEVDEGIGCWFNRAVVSSQAFSKLVSDHQKQGKKVDDAFVREVLLPWLANGLEQVVPAFVGGAAKVEGAVYHLTDDNWILPAFKQKGAKLGLVIDGNETDNQHVAEELPKAKVYLRNRGTFMHNKFLVDGDKPTAVLMGSANFTTGALTSQANVMHVFSSKELARHYLARKRLLEDDPKPAEAAKHAGWSKPVRVGRADVSVFFSPEPRAARAGLDRVVEAIRNAQHSVVFCLFSPTDEAMRKAVFDAGDAGLMMFGLVNQIARKDPGHPDDHADTLAKIELFHRSRDEKDVFAHALFAKGSRPDGFWWEHRDVPGRASQHPVFVHHKFVVIDGESDDPIIFTGSANMSGNSLHANDENLLQIRGARGLAEQYLCEFFRLYEHYRARAVFDRKQRDGQPLQLAPDARWADKFFVEGTPEQKARVTLARTFA